MILKENFTGRLMVVEQESTTGKHTAEKVLLTGMFAESDVINSNQRKYPRKVLEDAVENLQIELDRNGPAFGLDGHPGENADMKLENVSHTINSLWQDETELSKFYVNLQVLPTTAGGNLWTILKHGGAIGLSMRGSGETKLELDAGQKIETVLPGFQILGVDAVLNPSFVNAKVDKNSQVFESMSTDPKLSQIQEARDWKRWVSAKEANFRGTFEDYKSRVLGQYRLTESEQKQYTQARVAGARMTPEEFKKKIILKVK